MLSLDIRASIVNDIINHIDYANTRGFLGGKVEVKGNNYFS